MAPEPKPLDADAFISDETKAYLLSQGLSRQGAAMLMSELRVVYVQMLAEAILGKVGATRVRAAFNDQVLAKAESQIPAVKERAEQAVAKAEADARRRTLLGQE